MAPMDIKKRKVESIEKSDCVTELDVGIDEFVNTESEGFVGLIKQRYSDFQVNEINLDGEVVRLSKIEESLPKQEVKQTVQTKITVEENEHTKRLASIVSVEFVNKCFDLLNSDSELDQGSTKKAKTDQIHDKSLRTDIHGLIREGFMGILESRTDDGCVTVLKPTKRSRNSQRNGSSRQAEFLHFTLYKENKETMEAISLISKFLRIPPKSITFAGTKDRRAVTTQRACWRRGNPNRLSGLNGAFKGNIRLGDFKFESHTIKLGDLIGNEFGIVIRRCDSKQIESINSSLQSLKERGFINYFGLQRFGTFSVSSHTIGKYILCENYDEAVKGILNPQSLTIEESREAREVWASSGDASRALELMPRRCVAEHSILNALVDSPNSLNALLRIPHSLKTMYVHAYQSYIWNRAASERVRRNRQEPIEGDLIMGETDEFGVQRARVISKEEIDSKVFTIFDVVLPTPGNDVIYPENMMAFYEELMALDKIDCHDMRHKIKEFSMFGTYRHIMAKPISLEWSVRRYLSDDATILYTDKESIDTDSKLAPEEVISDDVEPKLAVYLSLGLATSQYATMALREAMKQETSRHGGIYFG